MLSVEDLVWIIRKVPKFSFSIYFFLSFFKVTSYGTCFPADENLNSTTLKFLEYIVVWRFLFQYIPIYVLILGVPEIHVQTSKGNREYNTIINFCIKNYNRIHSVKNTELITPILTYIFFLTLTIMKVLGKYKQIYITLCETLW